MLVSRSDFARGGDAVLERAFASESFSNYPWEWWYHNLSSVGYVDAQTTQRLKQNAHIEKRGKRDRSRTRARGE